MSAQQNIYSDIATRTGGDVYVGVVGPVRTGKSTFIKRFMEQLVLPNIEDGYERERARDEIPQTAGGRTVMTTEPKFVPDEAVRITVGGSASMRVKLADCVGYVVPDALGTVENGVSRMVLTPWSESPMPFEQAAEMGTRKVISEHSTVGILVTTDGSIGELPRQAYVDAEKRVAEELKALGKPFVIVSTKELHNKRADVMSAIVKAVDPDNIFVEENLALIAVVGRGMVKAKGTAARLFNALANAGVNIRMIDQGSSEFNIIVGVDSGDYVTALQSIYNEFVK